MRRLKTLIASVIVAAFGLMAGAAAQSVQQSGSVTPGHLPCWVISGVVQDCGSSTGSPRISSLGIFSSGGTPFAITSTSAPGAPTGQYVQLGMGVTTAGATVSVTPFGGLGTVPLNININGTIYPIGGSSWLSAIIDSQIGSTQGGILYRGATVWSLLPPGGSGQLLQSLGAGANPQWVAGLGGGTVTAVTAGTGLTGGTITTSGTIALSVPVGVVNGGFGGTTLPVHTVLIGNGTSAVNNTTTGTSGQVLQSQGASADPVWATVSGTGTVTSITAADGTLTVSPTPLVTSGTIKVATAGVANANLANMADQTVKGNVSGGSAAPSDLSATQVTAFLNIFSSSLKGLVPASGGGTTNFLRADGTFSAPASGGFSTVALQAFPASGTYTPTSGMKYCIVFATGSGGGGGGGGGSNVPNAAAGGGGAGATAIGVFTAATISTSQTVTIGTAGTAGAAGVSGSTGGTGGNTTFGALLTGGGGIGGGAPQGAAIGGAGGNGGGASSGTLNIAGGGGHTAGIGDTTDSIGGAGGNGGASFWGGGAQGGASASAGAVSGSYGGGGGGGGGGVNGAAGSAGKTGVVFVIEFI